MKKHFVLIMNVILVIVILGALGFTAFNIISRENAMKSAGKDGKGHGSVTFTEAATEQPTVDPSERYKIAIIQHANNSESNDCYSGFISEMNERGLIGNVDIVYIIEEDVARLKSEVQRLVDEKSDLFCTIGPFATKIAAALTKDIPIVFAGIADPEKAGLIDSNENPGGNITGVSSYTPAFEQIDLIKVILPQAKKIAAIYCSTDEYAVTQAIIGEKEAEELGMKTEKYPITRPVEIESALEELKAAGAEAIYLPVDKFIFKHMDAILAFANENKIPVFVGNETMLEAGAFATCTINYISIGRKAADQSCDILFDKKDTASQSVIYKYDCYNIVNQASLDTLGLRLNDTMRDQIQIRDYSTEE